LANSATVYNSANLIPAVLSTHSWMVLWTSGPTLKFIIVLKMVFCHLSSCKWFIIIVCTNVCLLSSAQMDQAISVAWSSCAQQSRRLVYMYVFLIIYYIFLWVGLGAHTCRQKSNNM